MSTAELFSLRYANPFVGRDAELAALNEHLGEGLVTVIGPGGVGKSRLLAEWASRLGRPVAFGDLAHCADLADALAVVADAVGLPSAGRAEDRADEIGRRLAEQPIPVCVLDTVEGAPDTLRPVIARWRQQAPQAAFVLGSRVALGLPGEVLVSVGPLGEPDAAALFETRAAAPGPLPPDAVQRVVARLSGIPLAIELAAARLEMLSLRELEARLADRFSILRDPWAPPEARQSTLWATIEWSWVQLSATEQDTLRQLAVFPGDFTAEAAEAVVSLGGGGVVLDGLHSLVRKSMLRVWPGPAGSVNRIEMFDFIREFVRRQGDAPGAAERHAAHYAALGERYRRVLDKRPTLLAEAHNFLAAFERALDGRVPSSWVLPVFLGAAPVLSSRRTSAGLLAQVDRALGGVALDAEPPELRGRIRVLRATALMRCGRLEESLAEVERALVLARAAEAADLEVLLLGYRGSRRSMLGLPGVLDDFKAAYALARSIGDQRGEAMALYALASTEDLPFPEHLPRGIARLKEVVSLLEVARENVDRVSAMQRLGEAQQKAGRLSAARETLRGALALAEASQSPISQADAHAELGLLDHLAGDLAAAEAHYRAALALAERVRYEHLAGFIGLRLSLLVLSTAPAQALPIAQAAAERFRDAPAQYRIYEGTAQAMLSAALSRLDQRPAAQAAATRSHDLLDGPLEEADWGDLPAFADAAVALAAEPPDLPRAREAVAVLQANVLPFISLAASQAAAWLASAEQRQRAWRIAADGSTFQPPDGEPVSLARRQTVARLLAALIAQRRAAPGTPLSLEELLEAGWPGEQLLASAARNRVYVAVSTLRRYGLEILSRVDGGYLLEPDAPVAEP